MDGPAHPSGQHGVEAGRRTPLSDHTPALALHAKGRAGTCMPRDPDFH